MLQKWRAGLMALSGREAESAVWHWEWHKRCPRRGPVASGVRFGIRSRAVSSVHSRP
jgi:hypothetical protein